MMMKFGFIFILLICTFSSFAQEASYIKEEEVFETLSYLASDDLKGRANYSPQLYEAANYIANRFQKNGLNYLPSFTSFFQPFSVRSEVSEPKTYDTLYNIVGVLPGKSLANEIIIFSAHYDHVGLEKNFIKDSVYNGANDNASGTTALLMLAKYFSAKADNERTIIFVAFSGEEIGMVGSNYFANVLADPEKIKAAINIEMIGRTNATGSNAFFVTGAIYSDLDNIIYKNLKAAKSKVRIKREPDYASDLFVRSDNYPLARKGIPAHTIMSSDDDDNCYHGTCDEIETIDTKHMLAIINAIAIGAETIISGKDTPKRILEKQIW